MPKTRWPPRICSKGTCDGSPADRPDVARGRRAGRAGGRAPGVARFLEADRRPARAGVGGRYRAGLDGGCDGQTLEDAGVVEDGERFRNYAKEQGEGTGFRRAPTASGPAATTTRIIERLNAGPPPPRTIRVVIPEGYRASEIAESLAGTGISSERVFCRLWSGHSRRRVWGGQRRWRGIPLPGDVRGASGSLRHVAGEPAGERIRKRLLPGRHELCRIEEPDSIRRRQDRLHGRA